MIYLQRSLHVFGSMMLVAGVLWLALARRSFADVLPSPWMQSMTAMAIFGSGALLITAAFLLRATSTRAAVPARDPGDWGQSLPEPQDEPAPTNTSESFASSATPEAAPQGAEGRAQSRLCLRPVWPQRPTDSWVGGLPELPEDMDWPQFDGRPASFLAQISLDGLPDTLWQGLGPRHGWLVYFTDPKCCTSIAVRHVSGHVEPRPQPQGVAQNWHWTTQPAALVDAQGLRHDTPPKWFLEITEEPMLGAVEDLTSDNPDYYDSDTGTYVWETTWEADLHETTRRFYRLRKDIRLGFDWPSFFAMFGVWQDWLEDRYAASSSMAEEAPENHRRARAREEQKHAALEAEVGTRPDAAYQLEKHLNEMARLDSLRPKLEAQHAAERDLLATLCPEVADLETGLREIALQSPFDTTFPEALETSMRQIDKRLGAIGAGQAEPHMNRNLPAALETYARQLYTRDEDALPQEIYDLFAPIWELQCQETVVFVGLNHDGEDGRQPDARLIDLPPNPLTGVTHGDMSRFYVDLPTEALQAEDWTQAVSDDTHGQ